MRMTTVGDLQLQNIPTFRDERGELTVGQVGRDFPFEVKRYFVVYGVHDGEKRGQHAHIECHQFLTCVTGSCSVEVFDGEKRISFELNRPDVGLHIPPLIWGTQFNHSRDCVLLVLASHPYEAKDYLRTEKELRAFRTKG